MNVSLCFIDRRNDIVKFPKFSVKPFLPLVVPYELGTFLDVQEFRLGKTVVNLVS